MRRPPRIDRARALRRRPPLPDPERPAHGDQDAEGTGIQVRNGHPDAGLQADLQVSARSGFSSRRSLTPSFCIARYRCDSTVRTRQHEPVCDFRVREALRRQLDELLLPVGEAERISFDPVHLGGQSSLATPVQFPTPGGGPPRGVLTALLREDLRCRGGALGRVAQRTDRLRTPRRRPVRRQSRPFAQPHRLRRPPLVRVALLAQRGERRVDAAWRRTRPASLRGTAAQRTRDPQRRSAHSKSNAGRGGVRPAPAPATPHLEPGTPLGGHHHLPCRCRRRERSIAAATPGGHRVVGDSRAAAWTVLSVQNGS